MTILVDADACPVKEQVVRLAKARGIPVVMLIDTSHIWSDGYSQVITVDKARDSVDFALIGRTRAGDVVVTQDFGVAAMALSVGARALNQNGLIFTAENMDALLMERHVSAKIRRAGGRTRNPHKRTREDDARFEEAFCGLLAEEKHAGDGAGA